MKTPIPLQVISAFASAQIGKDFTVKQGNGEYPRIVRRLFVVFQNDDYHHRKEPVGWLVRECRQDGFRDAETHQSYALFTDLVEAVNDYTAPYA